MNQLVALLIKNWPTTMVKLTGITIVVLSAIATLPTTSLGAALYKQFPNYSNYITIGGLLAGFLLNEFGHQSQMQSLINSFINPTPVTTPTKNA